MSRITDPLRASRDFRWLFSGQAISSIGDQLFPIAVAVLVLGGGGSAGDLGLVLAARVASLVLFALLGGVWADRLPRVRVLIGADAVRLVAVVGLLLAAASSPPVPVLAALTFAVGAGEAFFRPAYGALLPTVLPADQLGPGNALSSASTHLAMVLGPGLGGVLVAVTSVEVLFVVDAVTFGVSLLTLLRVREPEHVPSPRRRVLREMGEGITAVRQRPWIAAILGMATVQLLFVVAPCTVLLPIVVRETTGSTGDFGFVLAVGAVGGLLGALVAGRWRPRQPGLVGTLGLLAFGLEPLGLLLDVSIPVLAVLWFVAGLGFGPFLVYWESALQVDVPRELLARVISLDWMCSLALLPLGLALTGPVVDAVGDEPVLVVAIAVLVISTLLPLLVPGVRDYRTPADSRQRV
ncbi:MAG: MFS transporter [Mycobacteriales bacterium]|nr:MFS transporter [Mycobacteriales bacterium]